MAPRSPERSSIRLPGPIWTFIQWLGLLATVILLAGLIVTPDRALTIFWFVLIPILPATFLISPSIWRGACPLATLNMALNGLISKRTPQPRYIPSIGAVGLVVLLLMVPARRYLFNEHSLVLAITIVAVAIAALVLGAIFDYKAGFCNSICPVLPVERLYGQGPLLKLENPRCAPCGRCTEKACFDLAPGRSLQLAMGSRRGSLGWPLTPYGFFTATFPGFVFGYYRTVDGPFSSAGSVYLTVAVWMLVSFLVAAAATGLAKRSAKRLSPTFGVAAFLLYYWFTGPAIATEFGLVGQVGTMIQIVSFIIASVWLWKKHSVSGTFLRTA